MQSKVRRASWSRVAGQIRGIVATVAVLGFAPVAAAQDGALENAPIPFDANGPDVPPLTAQGPITLWSADGMRQGEARFALLGEGAGGLLQLGTGADDLPGPDPIPDRRDLLSQSSGLNLSAGWGLSDSVGVGLTSSLWGVSPGGRIGAGVFRVDVPVRLVRSDDALAVAINPWVGVPVGVARAGVASRRLSAGVVGAARVPVGPLEANLNLGVSNRQPGRFPDFAGFVPTQSIGGPTVDFGGSIGVRPGMSQVDLEFRGAYGLTAGALDLDLPNLPEIPNSNLFSELALTGGVPISERLVLRGGGAVGLTTGIGTSVGRGFLGLAWRNRPRVEPTITDVPPDPVLSEWKLEVQGGGAPLVGAVVMVAGSEVGRTGVDGSLTLSELDWAAGVTAEAPGYQRAEFAKPRKGEPSSVDLMPYAQPVPIQVQSADGKPLAATVQATADGAEPITVSTDKLELLPGDWRLQVSAEGYGAQVRRLSVVAAVPPQPVDVVLQPSQGEAALVHTVLDAEGAPVVGATVLLDGLPVGTTGEDGTIEIQGLAEGEHLLAIEHPSYTTAEQAVSLTAGKLDITTPLARVPGTVKVSARNANGDPVADAVVRFAGPRRLAPMPLGARGERTEVVGPGTWQLLISSVQYGFQQREVVVPERSWDLIEVSVVLQPTEGGQARLELRVVDPDGRPVDGAVVQLDGQGFGSTSTGGALTLDGLNAGQRELVVSSPQHRQLQPVPVVLVDGLQEEVVTLPWNPGTVRVTARTPDGVVDDAQARFGGPQPIPPTDLGPAGMSYFQVPAGEWSVLVTSPTHGIQQRQVVVEEDSSSLHDVSVVLNAAAGGLATLSLVVTDPDGDAVDGAAVYLDGIPLGNTSGGSLVAQQLAVGRQVLDVESPYFQDYSKSVQLMEGELQQEISLNWAAGLVKVLVRDDKGQPVPDGVVRLLGSRAIPPAPVNADGERLFALEPGEWQALAISPTLGMTQVPVLVTAEADGLQVVLAELRPIEAGLADLVVRVVDPSGRPVPSAEVRVDGESRGTTPAGGVVVVHNLVPGDVQLAVSAPGHDPATASVEVAEGSQVRYITLGAKPGQIAVTVMDQAGKPVDAEVSLVGPEDWMPVQIGADGTEEFLVGPGDWQVIASAPGLAAARADVAVSSEGQSEVRLTLSASRVDVGVTEVVIRDVVLFDFNAATLRPEASSLLDEVANTLLSNPSIIRVEVQGHSDNIGDLAYNRKLSEHRAESVRKALIERGVAPEKLTARGYGAQRPVSANDTEEGRSANRRVEFEIQE